MTLVDSGVSDVTGIALHFYNIPLILSVFLFNSRKQDDALERIHKNLLDTSSVLVKSVMVHLMSVLVEPKPLLFLNFWKTMTQTCCTGNQFTCKFVSISHQMVESYNDLFTVLIFCNFQNLSFQVSFPQHD